MVPRQLTEDEKKRVRALTRKVPREGGGEWTWPTKESVALERELSGATQQSRDRVEKMLKADLTPTTDQEGDPTTMKRATKPSIVVELVGKKRAARSKKAARPASAPKPAKPAPKKEAAKIAAKAAPERDPLAKGTVKATIVEMLCRKNGANESEVCERLEWKRAQATIGRTITAAIESGKYKEKPRFKGTDGRMRYFLIEK